MKLPWEREYVKIAFHAVAGALVFYIACLAVKNSVLIFSAAAAFLGRLAHILKPVFFAVITACLLSLPVKKTGDLFEKFNFIKKPERERLAAVSAVYGFLFMLVFGAVFAAYRRFESAEDISGSINAGIEEISDFIVLIQVKLAEADIFPDIENIFAGILGQMTVFIREFTKGAVSAASQAGDVAFSVFIGFVLAFYMLLHKEKIILWMKGAADRLFSPRRSEAIKELCSDITEVFSGYIGGQLLDALIMAVLISSAFSLIGIKYAVLIGVVSGVSNLIPYVGAAAAFVLSLIAALLTGSYAKVFYAAAAVIILQQIDSLFIVPKVVGKKVRLHPVFIILLLITGGRAFGLWGMVLAVPAGALIKLRLKKYNDKKQ